MVVCMGRAGRSVETVCVKNLCRRWLNIQTEPCMRFPCYHVVAPCAFPPPSVGELLVSPPGVVATRPSAAHTPLSAAPHTHPPLFYSPAPSCAAPAAAQRRPAPTHALPPTPLCRFVCIEWGCRRQRRSLLSTGAGWWPTPAPVASRHRTSQPTPASRSHRSVAVFSALLPFYASPCSAASRWWRIALATGFAGPLCCIASLPHARSPPNRGSSLSLSLKYKRNLDGCVGAAGTRPCHAHVLRASHAAPKPPHVAPTCRACCLGRSLEAAMRGPASPASASPPPRPPPPPPRLARLRLPPASPPFPCQGRMSRLEGMRLDCAPPPRAPARAASRRSAGRVCSARAQTGGRRAGEARGRRAQTGGKPAHYPEFQVTRPRCCRQALWQGRCLVAGALTQPGWGRARVPFRSQQPQPGFLLGWGVAC
jgi:hypothetical protein